jgi:hypothetical protein
MEKGRKGAPAARPPARTEDLGLRTMVTPIDYPGLAALLDGPDGPRLVDEIARLLSGTKARAHRRSIKRMARLRCGDYNEVVLLKDLSATGVRLLIRGDQALDIRTMLDMRLTVQLAKERCTIPLSLVRLCGMDGGQIDLACRFLTTGAERDELVSEIRSHIFDV